MNKERLYSPKYIKDLLDRYGFQFSKSLGQNFLIDGNIVRNTVQGAGVSSQDNVLEIGPGFGTLTEELALHAKKVVAIELDKKLLPVLEDTLEYYDNVKIIQGDVLDIDLNKIIQDEFQGEKVKVVANLPYYITTPILGRLLEEDLDIESITIMVQKEVAERMVANPENKTYGALSLFIKFYTDPEILLGVPKTVFMPQPKIDSAVIKLKLKDELPNVDKFKFSQVVKAGFSKRRKTILNSLSKSELDIDKDIIREALELSNIDPKSRAEDLSLEDFVNISINLP